MRRIERKPRLSELGEVDQRIHRGMQMVAALAFEARRRMYPESTLTGIRNVLLFPSLDAANIAYKFMDSYQSKGRQRGGHE